MLLEPVVTGVLSCLLKILVAEVMIYSEDFTQWTETA